MRQILIIAGLLSALILFGTVAIHLLTDNGWLESAYLAIITLTTVGSRDVAEDGSPGILLFTIFYLISGLGIFTYGAFELGHRIMNADLQRMWERRKMEQQIQAMNKHYIVCGLGRMGTSICEFLDAKGHPFVVVDKDDELAMNQCKERNWKYVFGDATDDEVLIHAGVDRASALATTLPTDADNVYVVLSARLLSSTLQIVARASDKSAVQKIQRAGATRVISPFSSGAIKMARLMISPSIEDFLEVTDGSESDLNLAEVEICDESPYVGKQLAQTDLRNQGVMVIGIRRADGKHVLAPTGDVTIEAGDSLFTFGSSQAVIDVASSASAPDEAEN